MTRRRIKHELIENESKRNATLLKRKDDLVKKADELSVLCGVHVAVVVHKNRQRGQSLEDNAVLWPSPPVFRERLDKFFNCTNFDRKKRMTVHEKFMEHRINEERESISRSKKRIEIGESQQRMNQLMQENKYFHELGLHELTGLTLVADEMLKKLETKEQQLMAPPLFFPHPPPSPHLFSSGGSRRQQIKDGGCEAPDLELQLGLPNLRNEQWFINAVSEEQAPPPDTDGANVAAPPNQ